MRLPHLSNLAWLLLSLGLVAACGGGSNEGNSVTISATAGGSASSDDGLLTLEVPPGALEADTRISIQAVSNDDLPDDVAAGAEGAVAYRLEPDGLRFSKPVIATLRLDPEELVSADEEGAFEVPLLFLQSEGEIPEVLANLDFAVSLDDGLASISGEVEHFSWIKLVKGPMALVLQQHNESKALGQPFQVTFYIGGGPIKDLRVGDHHLAIYGPDLDVSGSVIGSEQVTVLVVDGLPGTFFTGIFGHLAVLICTEAGKGVYSLNARAEYEIAVIEGLDGEKSPRRRWSERRLTPL